MTGKTGRRVSLSSMPCVCACLLACLPHALVLRMCAWLARLLRRCCLTPYSGSSYSDNLRQVTQDDDLRQHGLCSCTCMYLAAAPNRCPLCLCRVAVMIDAVSWSHTCLVTCAYC